MTSKSSSTTFQNPFVKLPKSIDHTTLSLQQILVVLSMKSITLLLLLSLWISTVGAFVPPSIMLPRVSLTSQSNTQLHFWGKSKTVKASHILIVEPTGMAGVNLSGKSGDLARAMKKKDAIATLEKLKAKINNNPQKFAQAAKEYSCCPSSKNGGDLGEFGPGKMVGNCNIVCFNAAVGEVHGPVWTPFGYHLIYIKERSR
jgi:peptidyl-prolyl cis-trans isomerase C